MKRALLLAIGLFLLPSVGQAQVELGVDAGLIVNRGDGESSTTFRIPTATFRFGFPRESISFESLFGVAIVNEFDETVTTIALLPGIVFTLGSNVYLRGEVVVTYVREAGSGASQFGFGGAVGTKRQIGDGPVFLRFEGGVDRLLKNDDFASATEFRALVGFSVVVN